MSIHKNEQGRSMVEILGVLAVVGILSVTGVIGYRQAMAQYKANEIWNDVLLRVQIIRAIPDYNVVSKRTSPINVDFSSLKSIGNSGYNITGRLHGTSQTDVQAAFSLTVSDVPSNVCEAVIKNQPNMVLSISPNSPSPTALVNYSKNSRSCHLSNKNNMQFYFDLPSLCYAPCNRYYKIWEKNCGTNWEWCNRSLGFFCQERRTTQVCPTGEFARDCDGIGFTMEGKYRNNGNYGRFCP